MQSQFEGLPRKYFDMLGFNTLNKHQILTFLIHETPLPQDKTAHFRVAFYCDQPRAHLCTNQHPDMPHLSGGWIILAKEKRSLTDLNKFVNKIWEKYTCCVCRKSLRFFISTREKWERNQKCCVYIFVQRRSKEKKKRFEGKTMVDFAVIIIIIIVCVGL